MFAPAVFHVLSPASWDASRCRRAFGACDPLAFFAAQAGTRGRRPGVGPYFVLMACSRCADSDGETGVGESVVGQELAAALESDVLVPVVPQGPPSPVSTGFPSTPPSDSDVDCWFWLRGYCNRGEDCRFKHAVELEGTIEQYEMFATFAIGFSQRFIFGNFGPDGRGDSIASVARKMAIEPGYSCPAIELVRIGSGASQILFSLSNRRLEAYHVAGLHAVPGRIVTELPVSVFMARLEKWHFDQHWRGSLTANLRKFWHRPAYVVHAAGVGAGIKEILKETNDLEERWADGSGPPPPGLREAGSPSFAS